LDGHPGLQAHVFGEAAPPAPGRRAASEVGGDDDDDGSDGSDDDDDDDDECPHRVIGQDEAVDAVAEAVLRSTSIYHALMDDDDDGDDDVDNGRKEEEGDDDDVKVDGFPIITGSSARTKQWMRWRRPCFARGLGCRDPTSPRDHSCK
jgi:hypothetical protein